MQNNMEEQFSRTELLLGREAMERLAKAHVAVFGVGGVGGYVVEALARSGVGKLDIVDNDRVALSNLNRQIIATMDTVGRYKVDVMRERILSINPNAQVTVHQCFFLPETAEAFDFKAYDYVVDAVDTVTAKIELVLRAQQAGVPIISSMGVGNKLNPLALEITDIYKTSVCPLAKVMRRELKKRGVRKLKVLYSKEEPLVPHMPAGEEEQEPLTAGQAAGGEERKRRAVPGSTSFVPSVAGLVIASEVIKEIGMCRE